MGNLPESLRANTVLPIPEVETESHDQVVMPAVSIVIVNWNSGHLLRRCVESIMREPPDARFEVLVVDNASSDGSVDWIREPAPAGGTPLPVRLIENRINAGFAKACNQAIFASRSPFVFLLNPDTEVSPGAIDVLVECLRSDRRIGACAPKLLNLDGTVQANVWSPSVPYPLSIALDGLGLYRLLPRKLRGRLLLGRHWDHSERRRVRSFRGAAIMCRREMIDQVGGLDERFELYGEDAEWCRRIDRAGWWLVFEPAARVTHIGGQCALKRWTDRERRLKEAEADLLFQRLCLSRFQFTVNTLSAAFVISLLRLRAKVRGKPVDYLDDLLALKMNYLKTSGRRPDAP
jgi:GT2 family glycosyltransferase